MEPPLLEKWLLEVWGSQLEENGYSKVQNPNGSCPDEDKSLRCPKIIIVKKEQVITLLENKPET